MNRMTHGTATLTGLSAFLLLCGPALVAQSAGADHKFVNEAAQGGLAEVELGTLATKKAESPDVKSFGQKMVDDHSKANQELKELASHKGITLPTSIDSKAQSMKDKLNGMSGATFDRYYMQQMVNDHQEDVAEFRKEANSGMDSDAKAFASKTLPTLEEHLKLAQSGYQEVKSGK